MRPIQRFTNDRRSGSTVLRCVLVVLAGLPVQVSAQSASSRTERLYGDWEVKFDFHGRQRTSILSLSRDPEGNHTGQWISSRGLSELEDVKREEGRLSFTWNGRNRDGQATTWKFRGTIKENKLSGTASSDGGEHTVEGKRIPPLPDIVGNYGFSYSQDEATFTLAIRVNREGKLVAKWLTLDGEVPVTDLAYEEGKLTFKSKLGSYEGSLTQQKSLNGTYTTDRGDEFPVLSLRLGTPMIGTWNLEVLSEQGSRNQRLKVNRDMSGWYGAVPIKEVHLKGDDPIRPGRPRTVTFKTVMKSGERTVELSFAGTATETKLSGEITTPAGTARVVGRKVNLDHLTSPRSR